MPAHGAWAIVQGSLPSAASTERANFPQKREAGLAKSPARKPGWLPRHGSISPGGRFARASVCPLVAQLPFYLEQAASYAFAARETEFSNQEDKFLAAELAWRRLAQLPRR
jgi:hypothetical protein